MLCQRGSPRPVHARAWARELTTGWTMTAELGMDRMYTQGRTRAASRDTGTAVRILANARLWCADCCATLLYSSVGAARVTADPTDTRMGAQATRETKAQHPSRGAGVHGTARSSYGVRAPASSLCLSCHLGAATLRIDGGRYVRGRRQTRVESCGEVSCGVRAPRAFVFTAVPSVYARAGSRGHAWREFRNHRGVSSIFYLHTTVTARMFFAPSRGTSTPLLWRVVSPVDGPPSCCL